MKELQKVSFEQAKKLKKLGFVGGSAEGNYYDSKGKLLKVNNDGFCDEGDPSYSAITTALALKWLRDDKKIFLNIIDSFSEPMFYVIMDKNKKKVLAHKNIKSHEEAELAGLNYALDYLIKISKTKTNA